MQYKFLKDPRNRYRPPKSKLEDDFERITKYTQENQLNGTSDFRIRSSMNNYQYENNTHREHPQPLLPDIRKRKQFVTSKHSDSSRNQSEKTTSKSIRNELNKLRKIVERLSEKNQDRQLYHSRIVQRISQRKEQDLIQRKVMQLMPKINQTFITYPPYIAHQPYDFAIQQPNRHYQRRKTRPIENIKHSRIRTQNYSESEMIKSSNVGRQIDQKDIEQRHLKPTEIRQIDYKHQGTPKKRNKIVKKYLSADLRKKFKKCLMAVLFPIFLRKHSQVLRKLRREYFDENIDSSFEQATQRIKDWFMHSSSKLFAILLDKKDININFIKERIPKFVQQKIRFCYSLVMLLLNNLDTNCQNHIKLFIQFIDLYCSNGSFITEGLLTRKELSYLSYSEDSLCLQATKSIQEVQILNFVFIKVFIYNILLQPWKLDENLKIKNVIQNSFMLGNILYRAISQLIGAKLKQKQPIFFKKGNMSAQLKHENLIYNNATVQQDQFISGLYSQDRFAEFIKFENGRLWKQIKLKIQSLLQKTHSLMKLKHHQQISYLKTKEMS